MSAARSEQLLTEDLWIYWGDPQKLVRRRLSEVLDIVPGYDDTDDAVLVRIENGTADQLAHGRLRLTPDYALFEGGERYGDFRMDRPLRASETPVSAANDPGMLKAVDTSQSTPEPARQGPAAANDSDAAEDVTSSESRVTRAASNLISPQAMSAQSNRSKQPAMLKPNLESVPPHLRAFKRWMIWRWSLRNGSWTKWPFQTRNPRASGKSNDPSTWATYDETASYLKQAGAHTGAAISLGDGIHGIDLDDVRDPATGELNPFALEVLRRVSGYAEVSPSGTGLKIFCRTNLTDRDVDHSRGVEMYIGRQYFTVTGHALPGREGWVDEVQDVTWLLKPGSKATEIRAAMSDDAETAALMLHKQPLAGWDADRIRRDIVPYLNIEAPYEANPGEESFIATGMALSHQFGGTDEGKELWDEIYSGSSKFQEGYSDAKYPFNQQRATGNGPITLASLIAIAQAAKKRAYWQTLETYTSLIASSPDEKHLKDELCPSISRDSTLDEVGRAKLRDRIKARFAELGTKLTMHEVRKLIAPRNTFVEPQSSGREQAERCKNYVWIRSIDKFFNTETKERMTTTAFNMTHNKDVAGDNGGLTREPASRVAMEREGVESIQEFRYLPHVKGTIVDYEGMRVVNSFNPGTMAELPGELTPEDVDAIEVWKLHMKKLLVRDEDVQMMTWWLAHNVQYPGIKIRWAPCIKGAEGDGKSTFGSLLAAVLGLQNVNKVNAAVLGTQFNAWAEGHCICVLEELRMTGHSRYDMKEGLKENITNDHISIHAKGRDPVVVRNVTNYIAFTNYPDALPLDTGDRRWWILSTPFTTREEVETELGVAYFKKLQTAIEKHGGALRQWLMEVEIGEEFKPNGPPPISAAKRQMIASAESEEQWLTRAVLAEGAPGVGKNFLSSSHFVAAMANHHDGIPLVTRQVSGCLRRAGWVPFDKSVKWRGQSHKFWMRSGYESALDDDARNALAREELDATLPEGGSELMK